MWGGDAGESRLVAAYGSVLVVAVGTLLGSEGTAAPGGVWVFSWCDHGWL